MNTFILNSADEAARSISTSGSIVGFEANMPLELDDPTDTVLLELDDPVVAADTVPPELDVPAVVVGGVVVVNTPKLQSVANFLSAAT